MLTIAARTATLLTTILLPTALLPTTLLVGTTLTLTAWRTGGFFLGRSGPDGHRDGQCTNQCFGSVFHITFRLFFSPASTARIGIDAVKKTVGAKKNLVTCNGGSSVEIAVVTGKFVLRNN